MGPRGLVAFALPSQSSRSTERAVVALAKSRGLDEEIIVDESAPSAEAKDVMSRVVRHLEGNAGELEPIRIDLEKLTRFRADVYVAARAIPAGKVMTYGELARAAGSPSAARAVGRALATNPIPLVVPCHRVLGGQGDLHGFSAPGGVRTKAVLLEIEGAPSSGNSTSGPSAKPASKRRASRDENQPMLPFDRSDRQ
jgi:methylated-DNA-[protein]-cysteine S-methyltransferase